MPLDHDRTITFPPLDADGRAFGLLAVRTDAGNSVVPAAGDIDVPAGAYTVLTLGLEAGTPIRPPDFDELAVLPAGSIDMLQVMGLSPDAVNDALRLEGITAITLEGDLGQETVDALAGHADLERVALRLGSLGDARLEPLLALERLDNLVLEGPAIIDEDLHVIGRMPALRSLMLKDTSVTGVGFTHLAGRPLTTLRLFGSAVDPDVVAVFMSMPALRELALQAPGLGRGHLQELGRVDVLEHLELFETGLTVDDLVETLPKHLPDLQRLTVLPGVDDDGVLRVILACPDLTVNGHSFSPKAARKLATARGLL